MTRARYLGFFSISILLVMGAGCQQHTVGKLLGTWVGQPDTAEARQQREAEKFGATSRPSQEELLSSVEAAPTDWEQFDVAVEFQFLSSTELEMSLAEGAEPQKGTWRILETSPTGMTIEVETPTGSEGALELRRFDLYMDERDGTLHGFLLNEVGADRGLGALYFQRPAQAHEAQ